MSASHGLRADDIARRCGGSVEGASDARATSWSFDSRDVRPGACFVALLGRRDGHDFVHSAFASGARVGIVRADRPLAPPGPHAAYVRVDDPLTALQQVARSLREERADLRVVAVAGSTGKTSTKDLLAAALASCGCHANAESYNNEFGLPITLCNTPASARVVVTEMGERKPGDLRLLCDIAAPDVGVVTNVGLAHAAFLGGPAGVVAVLSELLEALPASGLAVLNADDERTAELAHRTAARVLTVGASAVADYRIDDVRLDDRLRPSFTVRGTTLSVPLHGAHHVANAAMAAAVAHEAFGVPLDDVAVELLAASRGRWRMELLETDDGVTVLNDAYNANPTSMDAALVALAHLPVGGRRIAVLGDMRELGEHEERAHIEVGERAAALGLDLVVGVGAGGATIARVVRERARVSEVVADASEALDLVSERAGPGDAVLVKGSRALGLEAVAEGLLSQRGAGARGGAPA